MIVRRRRPLVPDSVEQRRAETVTLRRPLDEERREEPVAAPCPRCREAGDPPVSLADHRRTRCEHVRLLRREHLEGRRRRLEAVRVEDAPDRLEEQRMQRPQVVGGRGTKLHDRRD